MSSEIAEQVRRLIAESNHLVPGECPVEKRQREIDAERERKAREARAAEENRQVASTNWYAAVDDRIRTHFKDWAWTAIDERIQQWWKVEIEPLKRGIGGALGTTRERLRGEFKHAIEELADEVGTRLAALQECLASNDQAVQAAQARFIRRARTRRKPRAARIGFVLRAAGAMVATA